MGRESKPDRIAYFQVRVEISENGVHFKFVNPKGAGVGLSRDNPKYYDVIGEWFCREVEALSTIEKPR